MAIVGVGQAAGSIAELLEGAGHSVHIVSRDAALAAARNHEYHVVSAATTFPC